MEAHQETLVLPQESADVAETAASPAVGAALGAVRSVSDLLVKTALLVPGVLTVVLSFNSGSFYPGSTALAAIELAVLLALLTLVARRPLEGIGPLVMVVGGAFALLAGWTLLSSQWSHSESRAALAYGVVLLYLLAFLAFGSLGRTEARLRTVVYGLAAGIVAVCVSSLIVRTLPEVWAPPPPSDQPDRLSYPVSYWNALGMMAGVGILLCGHFACSVRDKWPVRVLGAAAVPLLSATLYYTFSRGATWSTAVGVLLYVIVARPRGLPAAALATVPTTAVVLMAINPATDLTKDPLSAAAVARGKEVALLLVACAAAAALIRLAALPLDRAVARIPVGRRARRAAAVAGCLAAVIAVVGALTIGDAVNRVDDKVAQFNDRGTTEGAGGSGRFLTASNNGRVEQWDIALANYRAEPSHGTGAGTFAIEWLQKRERSAIVVNAHSLYLETLTELGWPGLAMLVVVLGGLMVGLAMRARGPDRGIYAALLAAAVAWALHAAVDWDWQLPAVSLWLFAAGGLALAVPLEKEDARAALRRRWLRLPVVAGCLALAILPLHVLQSESHLKASIAAYQGRDCDRAVPAAQAAIAAMPSRPQPHQLIAACAVQARNPDVAIQALTTAIALDERNWALWYDLAIARAAAGQDPRPAARKALALNPLEPLAQFAVKDLPRGGKRAWTRRARRSVVLVPA